MPTGTFVAKVERRLCFVEDRNTPIRDVLLHINDAIHATVRLDLDLWVADGDKCVAGAGVLYSHHVRQLILDCPVLNLLVYNELLQRVLAHIFAKVCHPRAVAELGGAKVRSRLHLLAVFLVVQILINICILIVEFNAAIPALPPIS